MAATARYESVLDLIKEELIIDDDDDEVVGEEDEIEGEEPYVGEGLFAIEEYDEDGDDVPDRDPLSTEPEIETIVIDDEDEENDENVNVKQSYLPFLQELQKDLQDLEDEESLETQTPLVITAVSSLRVARVAGSSNPKAASFRNLDIFRCFLCKKDFNTFDDYIVHRTRTKKHESVPYDAEHEKSFACGICQRPWNQPRKALACAVYGHDPSQIYESMFVHACPLCPDTHFAFHSLAAVGKHWMQVHHDNPLPPFLVCSGNDQLPSIKISLQQISSVSESMTRENPNLVLDNCSSSVTHPSPNACKKELKVYRCIACERNFETRREVEIHDCSAKKVPVVIPQSSHFTCEDCGRKFTCARNFRFHLLRAGACRSDDSVNDFPFKCIHCGSRFNSFKSYKSHRTKDHAGIPFNPALELPFACKICGKPAFVQKQAMICALFGHDPSGLRKAMFKYKCSQCVSFGFHSPFALKRHWEMEHPNSEMPNVLLATKVDKPLPSVTISLDQLLSLKRVQDFDTNLVVEREAHSPLAKLVRLKSAIPAANIVDQATFTLGMENSNNILIAILPPPPPNPSVETANTASANKVESPQTTPNPVEDSVDKNTCLICNKWFKDVRRHMKVHDQSRFSGPPKHQCVCGKKYHLRNSLHSHWKKNKNCKLQYAKENEIKSVDDTDAVETKPEPPSQEYVLKIPSPTHSPFEDVNIKIEAPEIRAILEPEETENNSITQNEGMEVIDLYSEYEKFDAENSPANESIDLTNFIHLDVEEVQDDCDNNIEGDYAIVDINGEIPPVIEPKKPRVCMCCICGTAFPTQVMFLDHMSNEHKDTHPFTCRHCGKRFRLKDQRNKHEPIHDSTRFHGDPKFACDRCDQKYHLKTSLDTHRKIKHFGYVRPKSRRHLPIVQHRSIGAGRKAAGNSLQNSHECTECGIKFNFNYLLKQHIVRVHTERPFKCELCEKRFIDSATLRLHTRRIHEGIGKSGQESKTPVKKKLQNKSNGKNFSCSKCPLSFAKPSQLEQHSLIHTGEKPHVCDHCGRCFRLRKSMKAHKRIHESSSKDDRDNLFKCCVCGRHDFIRANDLHRHRLRKHKDVPYDRKREKAFGCGVCQKPYLLRSQAMVCAILGHDPTRLQEAMFKHKCPECPQERFGYHSVSSLRNHWTKEHSNKTMPPKFLPNPQNAADTLPCLIISKEKAAEIRSGGLTQKYDFPLVIEFDLICPDPKMRNFAYSPPPEIELDSQDDSSESLTEEELFLSTEITLKDALEAVKAVVINKSSPTAVSPTNPCKKQSPKRKRKSFKIKEENLRDSLAADRALGNRRIARVLERIRTARARKAAREST